MLSEGGRSTLTTADKSRNKCFVQGFSDNLPAEGECGWPDDRMTRCLSIYQDVRLKEYFIKD